MELIIENLNQANQVENILNLIVEKVQQIIKVDRAFICRFYPEGTGKIIAAALTPHSQHILRKDIKNTYLVKNFNQGKIEIITDIEQANLIKSYKNFLQNFQVKANITVPIFQEKNLWGIFSVQECAQPRQWQEWEINFLQKLAMHLQFTLERIEIYQQIEYKKEREKALHKKIKNINKHLDLKNIFATAILEIADFLPADRVDIFEYIPDRDAWHNVTTNLVYGNLVEVFAGKISVENGKKITDKLQQFEIVEIDKNSIYILGEIANYAENLNGAYLLVPLYEENSFWGVLRLARTKHIYFWLNEEIELISILSEHLTLAIKKAEIYHKIERFSNSLERQVQANSIELKLAFDVEVTLKRITDKLRDNLDEIQIMQTAVQELAIVLGSKFCKAVLFEMQSGVVSVTYESDRILNYSLNNLIDQAVSPEIYNQLLQGNYCHFCCPNFAPDFSPVTILICPIFDKEEVFGSLGLIHNQSYHAFSDRDIRLVQQVANHCAIALRQSRLYQASQIHGKELQKLNLLKEDFLSTISHELRTPMANIKLATDMLKIILEKKEILAENSGKDNSGNINRYLQIIQDEYHREMSLINDMLQLSQLNAGTEPLSFTTIDLSIWINYIMEPYIKEINSKGQYLQVNIPEKLPPINTDVCALQRIVNELLNNACKYTPNGEKIMISAASNSQYWQLCFSNSGVEIDAKECDRIFDKFYRIPDRDPWKYAGTGLGLALVKKLVEYLGGNIRAFSTPGHITFILEFPSAASSV